MRGLARVRASAWPLLQASAAASLAYLFATVVIGHDRPFFAPIAAIIALSVTLGQRRRRTVELMIGVAVGLTIADIVVVLIGTGTLQIGLVVLLSMLAAVFFGGGALLVNQAAISALLVVVLQPLDAVFSPERFLDALVGGGVALLINYVFPINPEKLVEGAARPAFEELVGVLEEVAMALDIGDPDRAERALLKSREIDDRVRSFHAALEIGHETARLSPTRRRALKHIQLYTAAGHRIELAVINVRVLARGAANATRRGDSVPPRLPEAVLNLAAGVRALSLYLEESEVPEEARHYALKAAEVATFLLRDRYDLATSVLVGQIRSAAVDLLRSTGMDQASALAALEEAAGRASEI